MYDVFSSYLKKLFNEISDDAINAFYNIVELKEYKKGDLLIEHEKSNNKFFIIKSGLVASFIRNQDGSDFIRTIYKQFDEVASLKSLITNDKSSAAYKCLMDSEVFETTFEDFIKLSQDHKELGILHIKVLEKTYLASEKRITELSALDGTERYLQLKKEIPNIDNLLPQYQIANYLNVTPVQLSRIRKKIFSK